MIVEVYTKNICPQCTKTKTTLDNLGIEYVTIPLFSDKADRIPSENFDFVSNTLGIMSAPAVVIWDDEYEEILASWGGHNQKKIESIKDIDESDPWDF